MTRTHALVIAAVQGFGMMKMSMMIPAMLDDKNNVWLVKGDSSLSIIHFPRLKLYVYASTEEILWKALIETGLFDELKGGKYDEIKTKEGDILKICPNGTIEKYEFEYSYFCDRDWWDYGFYRKTYNYDSFDYVEDLKSVAVHLGYSPKDIADFHRRKLRNAYIVKVRCR